MTALTLRDVEAAGGPEPIALLVVPPGTPEGAAWAAMDTAATGPGTPGPGQDQPRLLESRTAGELERPVSDFLPVREPAQTTARYPVVGQ